jgi:hypothetical protein
MTAHFSSLSRRSFLGTAAVGAGAVAADMTALDVLKSPLLASELKRGEKRVILLWLAGGASQLETFDPKPGRPTGGPYRALPTAEPGIHVSELMPKIAQRIKHTAIIRALDTKIADHGQAARLMHIGRRDEPSLRYPDLGAMLARELGQADSRVPDYVNFYTATEGRGAASARQGLAAATTRCSSASRTRPRTCTSWTKSMTSITSSERSAQFARGASPRS